jgi:CCR4-NOT transcription complex subunit 1
MEQLIDSITDELRFLPSNPMFYQGQTYRRIVVQAFQRALREGLPQLVERAVAIACGSSRDLLLKDFSMERDDVKLQHAAHLMVTKLAASVCLVTSRDELRQRTVTNIGEALIEQGYCTPDNIPEDAIMAVVSDNLDAACNIVRIAAQDKAVADMDAGLAPAYAARRTARESGQPFMEVQPFTQLVSQSSLPEPLRLHVNGLLPIQDKVYEDFGDQSRFQVQLSSNPPDLRTRTPGDSNAALGEVVESSILSTKITVAQSMEKFQGMIAELDKALQRATVDNLTALPLHHDIKMLIREIPVTVTQSASTDATALTFSQKVVQLLYKSESELARQVYVNILQRLCELSAKVAKEVSQWLIYAEDVRKFNIPVTISLIKAGLIDTGELDAQLARIIRRDFAPAALDFTAGLVLEGAFGHEPAFETNQVPGVIDALGRATLNQRTTDLVDRVMQKVQGIPFSESLASQVPEGSPSLPQPRTNGTAPLEADLSGLAEIDIRIQPGLYFLEWVRLFVSPIPIESSFVPFINRLQKQGILKGEEVSSAFFRTSISLAVEMFSKEIGSPAMYHGVDALSRLIVLLLKNYSDTHGVSSDSSKTLYFAKIFTIVALTLVGDQSENGSNFDQRPYHRFFSSLLFDLRALESSFPRAYDGCLKTFA